VDGSDFTAARIFSVLSRSKSGVEAVEAALEEVFPWARHLSASESSDFAAELVAGLSDAAELTIDGNAREVVAGWRATARIKADKGQHILAVTPTEGDFGPVEAIGWARGAEIGSPLRCPKGGVAGDLTVRPALGCRSLPPAPAARRPCNAPSQWPRDGAVGVRSDQRRRRMPANPPRDTLGFVVAAKRLVDAVASEFVVAVDAPAYLRSRTATPCQALRATSGAGTRRLRGVVLHDPVTTP